MIFLKAFIWCLIIGISITTPFFVASKAGFAGIGIFVFGGFWAYIFIPVLLLIMMIWKRYISKSLLFGIIIYITLGILLNFRGIGWTTFFSDISKVIILWPIQFLEL
ncbi:MAG: hypothetical protein A2544_00120 [Candidatus Zambryskibacteria bacterium RIFOXYD2_FULL_43_10]|uniref:Apolipoprotein N-acyltransferase n=1 Tax=Candidatus Zambryskibacteria bacterium RIFOXYD2_FULL_43_10 TaxID=1802782 RepID=A0A1G2V8F3_9BACT|nr:MAG: hypothetical protein A2544_00120 [Candidatus Zambryskibacteria bacterium RIFOXYD2_FULL_43_10]